MNNDIEKALFDSGEEYTLEIKKIVKHYRTEKKELKDYPNLIVSSEWYFMKLMASKFKNEITKGSITYNYDGEDTNLFSFEVKKKNHILMLEYFPFLENKHILFMFYKDAEVLKKAIKTDDLYYKRGNYCLSKMNNFFYLKKLNLTIEDEEPILKDNLAEKIQEDIELFFKKEDFYKKHKLTYKRGILLYGPPGNGKTSLIRHILKENTTRFGIIINCAEHFSNDIGIFLRNILKERPKILIFEDIDSIDKYDRSTLLNFLDGVESMENTCIIATTNKIEEIDIALLDRPSRFDRVHNIDLPGKIARKKLFQKFFPELKGTTLQEAIDVSKDFSAAYFKEIFIYTHLHECSITSAIKELKEQIKLYKDYGKNTYIG